MAAVVEAPQEVHEPETPQAAETFPFTEANEAAIVKAVLPVAPRPEDIRCLQQNIYYEARGEGSRGMQAVAEVTLNRANDPRFPRTVCGVVQQRAKGVCQFSWVCTKGPHSRPSLRRPADVDAWEAAGRIAHMVFDGTIERIVGNATHFHTTSVRPSWAKRIERIARVGAHIFYYERPRN